MNSDRKQKPTNGIFKFTANSAEKLHAVGCHKETFDLAFVQASSLGNFSRSRNLETVSDDYSLSGWMLTLRKIMTFEGPSIPACLMACLIPIVGAASAIVSIRAYHFL